MISIIQRNSITSIVFLCSLVFLPFQSALSQAYEAAKPRVIVLTDISFSEPDDAQSMIRLLLYSNVLELKGLIATSAVFRHRKGDPIAEDMIKNTINLYGQVRNNLLQHEKGFPTTEELLKVVKRGSAHSEGLSEIGDGHGSPGSNHIIQVLEEPDDRPVYILVWGGATTLAQAFYDMDKKNSQKQFNNLLDKIIVYEIGGQDEGGAWICQNYPNIKWLRSKDQWKAISKRRSRWENEALIGDTAVMVTGWYMENVQQAHGVLGEAYPNAKHRWEGDTPSFLYVVSGAKGLSDPSKWTQGGWGGRFGNQKVKNYPSTFNRIIDETPYQDYFMYPDVSGSWSYQGTLYNNIYVPIARWRKDIQNDFAARMDWSSTDSYCAVNHNPLVIVNNDSLPANLRIAAEPNTTVTLNAELSYDPDNDSLSFEWFRYNEAGSYPGDVILKNSASNRASVEIPKDIDNTDIHIILRVIDNGVPQLCAYKRIIIHCKTK